MTGETTMALMRIECPQADAAVIAEAADATLLSRPLRSLADIDSIESVPLAERLRIDNFCHRVALAIEARDPQDTAIHYVPDGDIDRADLPLALTVLPYSFSIYLAKFGA